MSLSTIISSVLALLIAVAACGCGEGDVDEVEEVEISTVKANHSKAASEFKAYVQRLPDVEFYPQGAPDTALSEHVAVVSDPGPWPAFLMFMEEPEDYQGADFPPVLRSILNKRLTMGSDPIVEGCSDSARDRIGISVCTRGVRYILYDKRALNKLSLFSFVYFREHEAAHHRLGHAPCGVLRRGKPQDEEEADRMAVDELLKYGRVGERILDHAIQAFRYIDHPRKNGYLSSKERSKILQKILDERLGHLMSVD